MSTPARSSLLDLLASRAVASLPRRPDALAMLRGLGIEDTAAVSPLQIGAGDDSLLAYVTDDERAWLEVRGLIYKHRSPLTSPGILIPTRDPRAYDSVTGFVKVSPGQQKHAMVGTAHEGIACQPDLDGQGRVVLVDSPVTLLDLHRLGCRHAALVEHPDVLPPLQEWIASRREIVIVAHRTKAGELIRAALGAHGERALLKFSQNGVKGMTASTWSLLGIDPAAARPAPEPAPGITPRQIQELHDYARGRVTSGAADEALDLLEARCPELITAYALGYIAADSGKALSRPLRRSLLGRRLGNCLVAPAYDEEGVIVDLWAVHADPRPHAASGLHDQPAGLLAPALSRGTTEIMVVDCFAWLARLFQQGQRNVLLLRGVADAEANATRLVRQGVRTVQLRARRDGEAFARVMRGAGLQVAIDGRSVTHEDQSEAYEDLEPVVIVEDEVEPPTATEDQTSQPERGSHPQAAAPSARPSVVFVDEDRKAEVATYQSGGVTCTIETRAGCGALRRVAVRSHGQVASDRINSTSDAQVQRFAANAARTLGIPAAQIQAQLSEVIAAVLDREEATDELPAVPVDPALAADAGRMLASPDLLALVEADLDRLGWVGEGSTKRLAFLATVSRLLPRPVWLAYQAGQAAAPWQAITLVASLTPPEHRLALPRLTESILAHTDRQTLRHRLLVLPHGEALRPETALALRVLHERGGVGWGTAGAPGQSSAPEAQGPVVVLAATTGELDPRLRGCFLTVQADVSDEQTARVLEDQRWRASQQGPVVGAQAIIDRHHALQRLLRRHSVRVPFADRISWPTSGVRSRQEQATFLGLVQASALLHQRQRTLEEGVLLASEADFELVRALVVGVLGGALDGLGATTRQLLVGLQARGSVTMADLPSLLPDGTRWSYRASIQELLDLGLVTSPRSGRGAVRTYRLTARGAVTARPAGIELRPAGTPPVHRGKVIGYDRLGRHVGELAAVGEKRFLDGKPVRHVG